MKHRLLTLFIVAILFSPSVRLGALIQPGDIFLSVARRNAPGVVYKINDSGDYAGVIPFASGLSDPVGLAFTPNGDLLVVERETGEVTDITNGGNFNYVPAHALGLSMPYGVAEGHDGRLYVSQVIEGTV